MKLYKQIETCLRIDEPTFVYANSAQNIMELLKHNFVGKNYNKCFIVDIERILKISECEIESRGPYCGGVVSICFKALVEVYSEGDIIFCNVVHRDKDHFVLEASNIKGYMKAHEKLITISSGMKMPCIVQKQQYSVGATNISMGFIPWLPNRNAVYYKVNGVLTAEDKVAIAAVMGELNKVAVSVGETPAESFFKKIVYPWSSVLPIDNETIPLAEFIVKGTYDGIYGRSAKCTPDDFRVEVLPSDTKTDVIEQLEPGVAVLAIVKQYLSVITMIASMKEVYNTDSIVTDHKKLWMVYNTERAKV